MATLFKAQTRPQAGSIAWLNDCIERSRTAGIFAETTVLTPGLAGELLRRNPDNRNISPTKAAHYTADISGGRWAENGEPIIISSDGLLNDGQHRAQAVYDANKSVPMIFVFGVTRDSRITVDQGGARGAGCYLTMQGTPYAKNAATVAKFVMAYERSGGNNIVARALLTNGEIVARVNADKDIVNAAAFAHKHLKEYRHLFSHTVMAACWYILASIDEDDADEFLTQIALGENIARGDPAFAVRSAFLSEKRERQAAMEVIFHGWNKYRRGGSAKIIRTSNRLPVLV